MRKKFGCAKRKGVYSLAMKVPLIVGVVNITTDSFSDGGKFLEPAAAAAHARQLLADGADIIELGAASSNPNAGDVPAELEIERLEPVLHSLGGVRVSIDTAKAEVQRFALSRGIEFINDVMGFPDASLYPELAAGGAKLVVMHSIAEGDRATRQQRTVHETFDSIRRLLDRRIEMLGAAGIARERLILDPGMGFFLGSSPEPSLAMLGNVAELRERYDMPVMISVSRKSFLRNLAPIEGDDLRVRTLAAELMAAQSGADYIRTHEPRPLRQALLVRERVEAGRAAGRFS